MLQIDVIDKECPKCGGLGKTVNPAWYPLLNYVQTSALEELDEPMYYVCKECNGRGKILTDALKDLLEYIIS